nr:Chain D, substrate p2-NC [Human immunodeficiency virus 1]4EQ0_P Chain P, substrate p2-NC [Human immunodeficiency virus 1]
ATIMMQRG